MDASAQPALEITIVEDDRRLREGLRLLLDGTPGLRVVGAWGSVEEALRASVAAPAVVLLDIELPGRSGAEAVGDFLRRWPAAVVLMLTVFEEEDRIFEALANGAVGYLLKRTAPARLIEAIREAHDGGSPMSPEIARKVIRFFQRLPQPAHLESRPTPQELRLLQALADGLGYQEVAERLGVSLNTVRTHVRRLYEKLHVHSRAGAVGKALRAGLI